MIKKNIEELTESIENVDDIYEKLESKDEGKRYLETINYKKAKTLDALANGGGSFRR